VRFIAFSGLRDVRWLRFAFRLFRVIPIDRTRARDGIRAAAEHLRDGEIVCVFPEGALTRTGAMQALRKGFALIARQADAPVVPAYIDGLWGSVYTFSQNRFFRKLPRLRPHRLTVNIGQPIPASEATAENVLEKLLEL